MHKFYLYHSLIGKLIGITVIVSVYTGLVQQVYAQPILTTTPISNASINYLMCEENQKMSVVTNTVEEKKDKYEAPAIVPSIPNKKPPSLNTEYLFQLINDHRKSIGLPPFEKNEELCKIAESRGPEIYNEIFVTGKIHEGFYARNLPYWATENMKYGGSEVDVLNWWLNSPIHRRAIEGNYRYSCGECYGNGCVQLFTNFEPK